MLYEVLLFWGLNDKSGKQESDYTLVLPNNHDIMSLNGEETHPAHTISKYFEINRSKRATLHLIKRERERKQINEEEIAATKVRHASKTDRFHKSDNRSPKEREEA